MSENNGQSTGRHRTEARESTDVGSGGNGNGSTSADAEAYGTGSSGTGSNGTEPHGDTRGAVGPASGGRHAGAEPGSSTDATGASHPAPGASKAAGDDTPVTQSTHRGTVGALIDAGAAAPAVPGRTLPIRIELARQLRRRRTQVSFALVALLPVILWAAFQIGGDDDGPGGGPTLVDLASSSGTNFAVFTLFASASFLLVVLVALFFGDTVASEASWSSLRYLLAVPVPRARLLRQKAVVAALLSVGALALLPLMSLLVGSLAYGAGDLVSPVGESLPFWTASGRVLLGALYIAVQLSWVAGLALLLSVSTDAPLGAVGGAVMASILSQILEQITALGDLRDFLPTHYADAWSALLSQDIDWGDMTRGAFSAVVYAVVFTTAAAWRFTTKDITS